MSQYSDLKLCSAERMASSGYTDEQIAARTKRTGAELAKCEMLLVNLKDATLTISQYDRAVKLMHEIYGVPRKK